VRIPRRVAIVGGSGAMGRWFERFLEARGHRVVRVDPRRRRPYRAVDGRRVVPAIPRRTEVVIVATPVLAAPGGIARLRSGSEPTVLLDLLSVKAPIAAALAGARRRGFRVASLHPLFGPSARPEDAPTVLVLDCGDASAVRTATELLTPGPLDLVRLPFREH